MTLICPYLGKSMPECEFTNDHIFPHAIGGGLDYAVRVSALANSTVGTRLEGKLVSSPLIQALRLMHGIRSRKGDPEWECNAVHVPTGRKARIVFRAAGPEVEIRNPITISEDGALVDVLCSPEQEERILSAFLAGQADHGRLVKVVNEVKLPGEYQVEFDIDAGLIELAMLKIAMGAAYEYLGPDVLADSIYIQCSEAMFDEEKRASGILKIPSIALKPHDHPSFLPRLLEHQHMAVVANIQLPGLVVGVQLFGGGPHSLFIMLSETSRKLLDSCHGIIAICDARTRKTEKLDFYEHQLSVCGFAK